jgi:hypothetical protein
MTFLSTHFTFDEAVHSQAASRAGISNDPPVELFVNIKKAAYAMELVRLELRSNPIKISSWYRSPKVNALVNGAVRSSHMTGFAVDFSCPTFGSPDAIVRALIKSSISYRQVIREFNSWVHIDFSDDARQALIIDRDGTREFTA